MLKVWLVGLVSAVVLVVAVRGQGASSDTSTADTAVDKVDSVLQEGLSDDTYDGISQTTRDYLDRLAELGKDFNSGVD